MYKSFYCDTKNLYNHHCADMRVIISGHEFKPECKQEYQNAFNEFIEKIEKI